MGSGPVLVEELLDPALLPDPVLPPDPFGAGWLPPLDDEAPRPWWRDEVDAAAADATDALDALEDREWLTAGDASAAPSLSPSLSGALAPGTFVPGAGTAVLLESLDLASFDADGLDADGLVGAVVLAAGQESWAAAVKLAAVSALVDRVAGYRGVSRDGQHTPGRTVEASRMAAAEVGAALALSPGSAANLVALATSLERLPETSRALREGRVDLATARMVVEVLAVLDDEAAAVVEARFLPTAAGRTRAQLNASLRRAVLRIDPDAAERRRKRCEADRRVEHEPLPDGMACLTWFDTAERIAAMWLWLTGMAEKAKGPAGVDDRTLDQRRADVLADLGERGLAEDPLPTRHGRRPHLQVVVGVGTLLELDDEPGELVGYGPVTAQVARRIAGDATWQRVLTDPVTGRFLEMSAQTYQPPQDLADHVVARDRTCRGPGCRRPANHADLDHRVPYPHGPTSAANLDAACRPFHQIKTLTDTTVTDARDTHGEGARRVTFPSGRSYVRPADPVLDDPPF